MTRRLVRTSTSFGALALACAALIGPGTPLPPAAVPAGFPPFTIEPIPVAGPPRLVEAGDVDGDGDLDLVVLTQDEDTTRTLVLRKHGASGFGVAWQDAIEYPTATWGLDLELGDLDEDEDLDLALILPGYGIVNRFNAGDGTFDALGDLGDQGLNVDDELADFDGDDVLDIAHYELDIIGYVGTRRGLGDGNFVLAAEVPIAPPVQSNLRTALGDVTGDGFQDMLLASESGLYLVAGKPNAPFFPAWQTPSLLLASGVFRDVTTGDLNGDRRLDVVASKGPNHSVAVLLGTAAGGLSPPALYPAGLFPAAIALADLDADGASDVIVANRRGGTISVLPGTGLGSLLAPVAVQVGRQLTDVTPADLDADGDIDLAVPDASTHAVVLVENQLVP